MGNCGGRASCPSCLSGIMRSDRVSGLRAFLQKLKLDTYFEVTERWALGEGILNIDEFTEALNEPDLLKEFLQEANLKLMERRRLCKALKVPVDDALGAASCTHHTDASPVASHMFDTDSFSSTSHLQEEDSQAFSLDALNDALANWSQQPSATTEHIVMQAADRCKDVGISTDEIAHLITCSAKKRRQEEEPGNVEEDKHEENNCLTQGGADMLWALFEISALGKPKAGDNVMPYVNRLISLPDRDDDLPLFRDFLCFLYDKLPWPPSSSFSIGDRVMLQNPMATVGNSKRPSFRPGPGTVAHLAPDGDLWVKFDGELLAFCFDPKHLTLISVNRPGLHRILDYKGVALRAEAHGSSDVISCLSLGCLVNVIETTLVAHQIHGRVEDPSGWILLFDVSSGCHYTINTLDEPDSGSIAYPAPSWQPALPFPLPKSVKEHTFQTLLRMMGDLSRTWDEGKKLAKAIAVGDAAEIKRGCKFWTKEGWPSLLGPALSWNQLKEYGTQDGGLAVDGVEGRIIAKVQFAASQEFTRFAPGFDENSGTRHRSAHFLAQQLAATDAGLILLVSEGGTVGHVKVFVGAETFTYDAYKESFFS